MALATSLVDLSLSLCPGSSNLIGLLAKGEGERKKRCKIIYGFTRALSILGMAEE